MRSSRLVRTALTLCFSVTTYQKTKLSSYWNAFNITTPMVGYHLALGFRFLLNSGVTEYFSQPNDLSHEPPHSWLEWTAAEYPNIGLVIILVSLQLHVIVLSSCIESRLQPSRLCNSSLLLYLITLILELSNLVFFGSFLVPYQLHSGCRILTTYLRMRGVGRLYWSVLTHAFPGFWLIR